MKRKALVIRFSAIGDCVMSVPVAAAIRRAEPKTEIWWAIEPRCAPIVDHARLVDHVEPVDRMRWKNRSWSPAHWREQFALFARLREQRFEFGIDLQGHSKTGICLRVARPTRRISVKATDVLARLMNPVATGDRRAMHTVEWNLHCLNHLGDFGTEPRWVMPALTAERRRFSSTHRNRAVIASRTGHARKNYPLDHWIEVGDGLMARGLEVAFVGAERDSIPERFTNMTAELALNETMAVIAESKVVLAGDTGAGHLAAAYGVPVVSIFGPTSPTAFAPYTERRVVLRKDSHLTAEIRPADVLQAVDDLILERDEAAVSG